MRRESSNIILLSEADQKERLRRLADPVLSFS
jgi:hypothetical protein